MDAPRNLRGAIKEMYPLDKGVLIARPIDDIRLGHRVSISRRALKHIIEERKADGYSLDKIYRLLVRVLRAVRRPGLIAKNLNKKYPNSIVFGRSFTLTKEYAVVICEPEGESFRIINAFYRSKSKYDKLKAKSERR
ncbi:MAG TPA: hypothetical protein VFQ72_04250 [Candidatus Paceibacterota bacterium]|nr:hypothetical protein [Candidatus Paceibacterota bacterium]